MCKFLGYGPPQSKTLFIGLEEYAALDTLEENLGRRCTSIQTPYDDKNRFHRDWARSALDPGSGDRVKVWMISAMIMRALDPDVPSGYVPTKDGTDWHQHYCTLGTSGGTTFLAELFPIPRHKWRYWGEPLRRLFPEFNRTHEYQDNAWNTRRPLLEHLLTDQCPELVICYGVHGFPYYEQLFSFQRTEYDGRWETLHTLGSYRCQPADRPHLRIGLTTNRVIVAMTGFFKGQHPASAFTETRIPTLVSAIRSFRTRYLDAKDQPPP